MIKLNKYNVVDTATKIKARVWYSHQKLINDHRDCVTLYAKDYDKSLGKIFGGQFHDDSDLMTDYFDKGRVRIFSDHPLFAQAVERAS